jgi:hypothetical protein
LRQTRTRMELVVILGLPAAIMLRVFEVLVRRRPRR